MRWVSTRNRVGSVEHKLEMPEAPDLDAAYVAFWRRILGDAIAQVDQLGWWTIAFQLSPRESPDEGEGKLKAGFWNASNHWCAHPNSYVLPSEAFVVLDQGQGDAQRHRELLTLYLEHYGRLREAAAVKPVPSLFRKARALRPLKVVAAVLDGWLDLRIGQPQTGPLPEYDRNLLAGDPAEMRGFRGGLCDGEWLALLHAVSGALIRFTPEHFETIECMVRAEGNRLFYQIGCPDFPDEGTTEPGQDVHQAMSRLVAHKIKNGEPFVGMRFVVQIQSDGTARTHAETLN